MNTRRFTLDVGTELDSELSEISSSQGVTKAEIIRRALALYMVVKPELRLKRKLAVVDEEEKILFKVPVP